MKTKILIPLMPIFCGAALYGQSYGPNDLYYKDGSSTTFFNTTVSNSRWTDAEGAKLNPTAQSNLFIDGAYLASNELILNRNGDDNFGTVANLTFQNLTSNFSVYTYSTNLLYTITGSLNAINTGGSFIYMSVPAIPGDSYANASDLVINENLNITGARFFVGKDQSYSSTVGGYQDGTGPKTLTVKGDVNITGAGSQSSIFAMNVGYNAHGAELNTPQVFINGVVNMNSSAARVEWRINVRRNATNDKDALDAVIELGGLNSSPDGNSLIRNDCQSLEGSSTLVFKNTGKSEFVGGLLDEWDNTRPSKIKLVMDGTGTQYIRTKALSESNFKYNFSGGVEVKNGTLGLYTFNNSAGDFLISGGNLLVLGASESEDAIGVIKTDNVVWDGGAISMHTDGEHAGYIDMSAGSVFTMGDSAGEFRLILDDAAVGQDGSFDFSDIVLISGDSLNFSTQELERMVDLSSVIYNGSAAISSTLSFELVGEYLVVSGSGVVPEPAAVAAIFGSIALFAAIMRRRKCK